MRLETEAKLLVQKKVRDGGIVLVWSYVLDYENSSNLQEERREEIQKWDALAKEYIEESPEMLQTMRELVAKCLLWISS